MNWITTQEFISMLKRFPEKQIEVSLYLGRGIRSTHWWEYHKKEKMFWRSTGNGDSLYTENEILRYFGNQRWKPLPFFFLNSDNSKRLALRLVEELISYDHLEEVISEHELDNVRECSHCHQLMEEGWIVADFGQYCSDNCLQEVFPRLDMEEVKRNAGEEKASIYWTKWEG